MEKNNEKTTLEKFNDIFLEESRIFRERETLTKQLIKETVTDIGIRIKNHQGERIALAISGVYEHTLAYGPVTNRMQTERFNFVFIGRLKKNSTFKEKIPTAKPNFKINDEYIISVEKLFQSEYPVIFKLNEITDKHKRIVLQKYHREALGWKIEDLIASSLDEKTWKRIFPHKQRLNKIQLFIGNEEFEKFLSGRNGNEITIIRQLNIW